VPYIRYEILHQETAMKTHRSSSPNRVSISDTKGLLIDPHPHDSFVLLLNGLLYLEYHNLYYLAFNHGLNHGLNHGNHLGIGLARSQQ